MNAERRDGAGGEVKAGGKGRAQGRKTTDGRLACPRCGAESIWRNGQNSAGNQQYRCRHCSRVFVAEPYIGKDISTIADRLLSLEVAVPVIAAAMQGYVSRRWLYERRRSLQYRGALS